jgi:hypothetical protein
MQCIAPRALTVSDAAAVTRQAAHSGTAAAGAANFHSSASTQFSELATQHASQLQLVGSLLARLQ